MGYSHSLVIARQDSQQEQEKLKKLPEYNPRTLWLGLEPNSLSPCSTPFHFSRGQGRSAGSICPVKPLLVTTVYEWDGWVKGVGSQRSGGCTRQLPANWLNTNLDRNSNKKCNKGLETGQFLWTNGICLGLAAASQDIVTSHSYKDSTKHVTPLKLCFPIPLCFVVHSNVHSAIYCFPLYLLVILAILVLSPTSLGATSGPSLFFFCLFFCEGFSKTNTPYLCLSQVYFQDMELPIVLSKD